MSDPCISVIIRNRNEARHLELVLRALSRQTLKAFEVVVVDNESTDDSREIAIRYGAQIIDLPRAQFTYGRALNDGIRAAKANIALLLSSHSLPVGSDFLTKVAEAFDGRPELAAVRCLLVEKRTEVESWMEPSLLRWPLDLGTVVLKGPAANGCALRREVWEQAPFDEDLEAVEDKFWAFEVLKRGYQLSSCEATYCYLRSINSYQRIQKTTREHLAFYRKTGRQWQDPPVRFANVVKAIFVGAPRAALGVVARETFKYASLKSVAIQSRRKPQAGAIR
jgi:glycosyltransferase involved in cell wall biosynthesis